MSVIQFPEAEREPLQIPLETHERIVEAMEQRHRTDLGKLEMRLVTYRKALLEAGVEPPDVSGKELLQMWQDAAAVTQTASEFVCRLGSAKELLSKMT